MSNVTAMVRVMSGARAGHVVTSHGKAIFVGREPGLELRFDPDRDLEVSGRHAAITEEDGRWWITDLGSRNGTYVNGEVIEKVTPLHDGDMVVFGASGPTVEVRIVDPEGTRVLAHSGASPQMSTPRMSVVIRQSTQKWRYVAAGTAIVLGLVIGVLAMSSYRQRQAWDRDRALLLARTDSALAASSRAVTADQQGMVDALRESQQAVRDAAARLQHAERAANVTEQHALQSELRGAIATLDSRRAAASIDRDMIRRVNENAVAKVFIQARNGEVSTGSAFAVRSDATLITNAHVVYSGGTGAPARVGVQFANSDQVWPARVLAADMQQDLAVIKVDAILGAVPTVHGLNAKTDSIRIGAPVLLIGFPLGGESMPSARLGHQNAMPVTNAGSITATGAQLEVRGYGAAGSSGSPVFDSRGDVIGIVYGGRVDAGKRSLLVVPASAAVKLLSLLPAAPPPAP